MRELRRGCSLGSAGRLGFANGWAALRDDDGRRGGARAKGRRGAGDGRFISIMLYVFTIIH